MNIYVYDPIEQDSLSKVRGIGRYLQTLRETLPKNTVFTSDLNKVPFDSIFVNPFINLVQPPLITKRISKRQIGIIHDVIPLQFPQHFPVGIRGKLYLWRNKLAFKHYDLFIANSKATRENMIEFLRIEGEKIKVIYPTLPKIFGSKNKEVSEGSPLFKILSIKYLIYAGDVTWNKNLVNLAKTIKLGNIPCVFVGKNFTSTVPVNSWTTEFHEFMELAYGDKRFIFTGFVSDEELKTLYKNAVANILISREEGYGFSYFEAASQGTPSVLSDIEIFHETSADAALFVDLNNPENIAQSTRKIAEDKALRKNLSQKAFERFQSLPDSVAQWESLLESLKIQQ